MVPSWCVAVCFRLAGKKQENYEYAAKEKALDLEEKGHHREVDEMDLKPTFPGMRVQG